MSRLTKIAKHNAHWGALMGYDWMVETPSLIFTEMDESESIGKKDDVECLIKRDNGNELHSFLLENKVLTAFPVLKPSSYQGLRCHSYSDWDEFCVERSIDLEVPVIGKVTTFAADTWRNCKNHNKDAQSKYGISAYVYRLYRSAGKFEFEQDLESDDNGTSYQFDGATLKNITPAESFYHLGWFADICFEKDGEELSFRVWIHKKNIDSPPVEGDNFSGSLWLQSSLED